MNLEQTTLLAIRTDTRTMLHRYEIESNPIVEDHWIVNQLRALAKLDSLPTNTEEHSQELADYQRIQFFQQQLEAIAKELKISEGRRTSFSTVVAVRNLLSAIDSHIYKTSFKQA